MKRTILTIIFTTLIIGIVFISIYGLPPYTQLSDIEKKQNQYEIGVNWEYEYIKKVPPIIMRDPLIEMIGQTSKPIPYYYEEAVKLTGHSCMIVAASWTMTRLALEHLYPNEEIPVRGQIMIEMPGAKNEWNIGIFGEVMTFITGASSNTGFSGSIFAKANSVTIRRNKMTYKGEPVGTVPPKMKWVFTRLDNGKSVAVSWNISLVQPSINEKNLLEHGYKLAAGTASQEEVVKFITDWNDAALFVLKNSTDGLFTIEILENN